MQGKSGKEMLYMLSTLSAIKTINKLAKRKHCESLAYIYINE